MDLKDFQKIASCGVFSQNYSGFMNEKYIFELAKKYQKVILYSDCNGKGLMIDGATNEIIDNKYKSNLLKSDVKNERLTFFNSEGSILTKGIIFDILLVE